jgi:hypothetical protein
LVPPIMGQKTQTGYHFPGGGGGVVSLRPQIVVLPPKSEAQALDSFMFHLTYCDCHKNKHGRSEFH